MRLRKLANTVLLVLVLLSIMIGSKADEQPEPTMFLYGYVFVRTISEENTIAPEGLEVSAKLNSLTLSITTIQTEGRYTLPISGLEEGTPVDVFVQNIQITTIHYYSWNVTWLNLTVIDSHPPLIEPLSPVPDEVVLGLPVLINATVTDDLAVNKTAVSLRMNQTDIRYDLTNNELVSTIEDAIPGFYTLSVTAEDFSGNLATKEWDFTLMMPQQPSVEILYPTTESPIYTRPGQEIFVAYSYTELYPADTAINIYNATHEIGHVSILLSPGTNEARNDTISIDETAQDGKYTIGITLSNIFNMSEKAEKIEAVIVDNTPPVIHQITQDPPPESVQPLDRVRVNATITDQLSGILVTNLLWRIKDGEWNIAKMERMTDDIYTGDIPELQDYTVVYYKIETFDRVGNQAVEDNAGQFHTYQVLAEYPTMILLMILFTLLPLVLFLNRPKKTKILSPD